MALNNSHLSNRRTDEMRTQQLSWAEGYKWRVMAASLLPRSGVESATSIKSEDDQLLLHIELDTQKIGENVYEFRNYKLLSKEYNEYNELSGFSLSFVDHLSTPWDSCWCSCWFLVSPLLVPSGNLNPFQIKFPEMLLHVTFAKLSWLALVRILNICDICECVFWINI